MSRPRNLSQNDTDSRNNNEEIEDLLVKKLDNSVHADVPDAGEQGQLGISSAVSSTVAAVTSLLRWSPQHIIKKRSAESDQESQSSGSMNSDSPSKTNLPKFSSTPYLQAKNEIEEEEIQNQHREGSFGAGIECRHRHSFNYDNRRSNDMLTVEDEPHQEGVTEGVSWHKSSGVMITEKNESKTTLRSPSTSRSNLTRGSGKSLSFRETSSYKSSSRTSDKMSDSGSRSSSEYMRAHSRERSFEKSLENIMDKCSEKSADISIGLESKNGVVSDSSRIEENSSISSIKKSDKKKKNTPWYTVVSDMWNTSYKSKSEDFRKIFKIVGKEDRLLVDYSCALQKEILVQGRMYVTQNWVCFYANIFTWETLLAIPCKEITSVTKEKTARVIPNAIQISTDKEKYFFTSLGNRDKTYMMLFRIWQNALLSQPMSAKEMWQWVHYNYGEELCLTSSDEDYVAPPSMIEEPSREDYSVLQNKNESLDSDVVPTPDLPQNDIEQTDGQDLFNEKPSIEGQGEKILTDQSDTTEDSEGEVTYCAEHSHLDKQLLNEVYSIPVDKMFEMLFTESPFYLEFHTRRGNKDFEFTPWVEDSRTGHQTRTVTYTIPLNYSIGPKSTQTVEKQLCHKNSKNSGYYTVDAECVCLGIPYGNTFMVLNRYCLSRINKHKTRLQLTTEIRYKKSVWGLVKSMIEKNSSQGCIDHFNTLSVHLKQESEKFDSYNLQQQTSIKRKVRKKRLRTQHPATAQEIHKLKPTRHLSLIDKQTRQSVKQTTVPPSPIRNVTVHKEDISKLNADTLVRVILVVLVLLVMFNAVLFYKLWSLESYTNILYFPRQQNLADNLQNYPKTQEEWTQLLIQQKQLHEREMDKWKEIISSSITLIDQIKSTLTNVKNSLEGRLQQSDINNVSS